MHVFVYACMHVCVPTGWNTHVSECVEEATRMSLCTAIVYTALKVGASRMCSVRSKPAVEPPPPPPSPSPSLLLPHTTTTLLGCEGSDVGMTERSTASIAREVTSTSASHSHTLLAGGNNRGSRRGGKRREAEGRGGKRREEEGRGGKRREERHRMVLERFFLFVCLFLANVVQGWTVHAWLSFDL